MDCRHIDMATRRAASLDMETAAAISGRYSMSAFFEMLRSSVAHWGDLMLVVGGVG
jgi:hypothetical protein